MNEIVIFALSVLYGIKEIVGERHNPFIIKLFKDIGHSWVTNDETAWCSASHCWIHKQLGYQHTGKLNARSWEHFGEKLSIPVIGCTVVLWRISPSSGYGHVGIFIKEDENYIWILGGNQNNEYNISKFSKSNLLSYRQIPKL